MNKQKYTIKIVLIYLFVFSIVLSCKNNKSTTNVLLQEWTGPYGGIPAFDKMQVADIQSAVEQGMKEKRRFC